jgi:hypothetical protein
VHDQTRWNDTRLIENQHGLVGQMLSELDKGCFVHLPALVDHQIGLASDRWGKQRHMLIGELVGIIFDSNLTGIGFHGVQNCDCLGVWTKKNHGQTFLTMILNLN